ncbi:MAG: TlyA family RNA methyltransferase [Leptospirales bacterium]
MRLDEWLIEHGLAPDQFTARGLVLSAKVLVNDEPITKTGHQVEEQDVVRVRAEKEWVSRAGNKLRPALDQFNFSVKNSTFVDFGASHGGFTEALLQYGAKRVAAVDVSYGILVPKLRNNDHVQVIERTHVCELTPEKLDFTADYFVADLSFISLRKVLKCVKTNFPVWEGIALFKPQFEVPREELLKGIVKNETYRVNAISDFKNFLIRSQISEIASIDSSIKGSSGNLEVLFHLKWGDIK